MPEVIDVKPERVWYEKVSDIPGWAKKAGAWFAGCGCLAIVLGGIIVLVLISGIRGCGTSHSESRVEAPGSMSQVDVDRIASEVARRLPTPSPRPTWKTGEQIFQEGIEKLREQER